MNSTDRHRLAGEGVLDRYIEAAREQFDAAEIEPAAQRLRKNLPNEQISRPRSIRWMPLVGAASILLAVITAVSVLLPGSNGSAFAQAQQWFASFRTLQIETTVELGQDAVTSNTIWLHESGDVRIESAGIVTLIKPEDGMIYTQAPDGQAVAQRFSPSEVPDTSTEWIEDLRDFQGEAQLLAETRYIDGISAIGYSLATSTSTFALWVDPFDNRPLLVEAEMPGGVMVRNALSFDISPPTGAFDAPENAQPIGPLE